MRVIEKIARGIDPHPFAELDTALLINSGDTMHALYIDRLRMHTETPLANARKVLLLLREPPQEFVEGVMQASLDHTPILRCEQQALQVWQNTIDAFLCEE